MQKQNCRGGGGDFVWKQFRRGQFREGKFRLASNFGAGPSDAGDCNTPQTLVPCGQSVV